MTNLNTGILRKLPILIPPIQEQEVLLRQVGVHVRDTLRAISSSEREIKLLREYRTRLIAAVVTGMLDVRDVAAGLSDEIEGPEPLDEAESEPESEDDRLEAASKEAGL
jgi:type I restriction enzyme S subunit